MLSYVNSDDVSLEGLEEELERFQSQQVNTCFNFGTIVKHNIMHDKFTFANELM